MLKGILRSGFTRIILICLVLGVCCLIFGFIELSDSKKTPVDFNSMSDSDVKVGTIVEGDLYYNFGVFETVENKRNGHTESTYYRYVIPVGEESYMGIQVTDQATLAQMDAQTDETYDMMDGKIEDTTTTVHFKGKIVKMDNEDYGYFKDFMSSGGFTDEEIEKYASEYYIQIRDFGGATPLIIIGIVALLIAGILIFVSLGKAKKAAPVPPQNFGGQQGFGQPQAPQQPQTAQDFNQYFAQQPGQPQAPQQPQDFGQQPPQGPTNF